MALNLDSDQPSPRGEEQGQESGSGRIRGLGPKLFVSALPAVVLLLGLIGASCSYRGWIDTRSYSITYERPRMESGFLGFSVKYTGLYRGEDIGNAVIDSGGALYAVYANYLPSCRDVREIDLVVDSVAITYSNGIPPRTISRQRCRRDQEKFATSVVIGPISLPPGQFPDFDVRFRLRVVNRSDSTLIEEKVIDVHCSERTF